MPWLSATMLPKSPSCLSSAFTSPWFFLPGLKWPPASLQELPKAPFCGIKVLKLNFCLVSTSIELQSTRLILKNFTIYCNNCSQAKLKPMMFALPDNLFRHKIEESSKDEKQIYSLFFSGKIHHSWSLIGDWLAFLVMLLKSLKIALEW